MWIDIMAGSADIVITPNIVNVGQTFIIELKPKPNRYMDFEIYTYTQMEDSTYAELASYL